MPAATPSDHLGRLLLVTLEAARVQADLPVLGALRSWLNSWRWIGDVERSMAHQGFDLQLTRYDERGWRADPNAVRLGNQLAEPARNEVFEPSTLNLQYDWLEGTAASAAV